MNSGEKIKALRLARGLTLEEVGQHVGVGKSTVRKWETGAIANMRRDKIAKLAEVLGTTPADIIGIYNEDSAATPISDEELQFALFGGRVSEEAFAEVKRFAAFVAQQEKEKAK